MRPQRLTFTAIGSYPGTVEIDYDALSPHGLFHIHGPTGGGKSSLLDAMCFALYGTVPGSRRADGLRSHHADSTVEASAALEFSAHDADWRIVRTPTQWRGKRRGSGVTEQRATANLQRRTEDGWAPVASGAKEVDPMVRQLVGLDADQFLQVVVLPQGEFQRALRAGADERGQLLRTLFHTERFDRYVQVLKDRAAAAKDAIKAHEERISAIARQVDAVAPGDDPLDTNEARALAVATDRLDALRAKLQEEEPQIELARAKSEAAVQAFAETTRRMKLWQRRVGAQNQLSALEEQRPEHEAIAVELQRAAQVEPLRPLLVRLQEQRDELMRHTEAVTAEDSAARRLLHSLQPPIDAFQPPLPPDQLGTTEASAYLLSLRKVGSELGAAVERSTERDRARERRASLEERRSSVARELAELGRALAQLRPALVTATEAAASSSVAAHQVDALTATVAQAHDQLAAAARVQKGREVLTSTRERLLRAEEAAVEARSAQLRLLERRLAGMADELAANLVDGEPCAVCGSSTHPHPARGGAQRVTDDDLQAAEAAANERAATADQLRSEVDRQRHLLDDCIAAAGPAADDPAATAAAAEAAAADLNIALAAAERLPALRREIEHLTRTIEQKELHERELEREQAAVDVAIADLDDRFGDVPQRSTADLMSFAEQLQRAEDAVESLRRALQHRSTLEAAVRSTHEHLLAEAGARGIESLRVIEADARTPDQQDFLRDRRDAWQRAVDLARHALEEAQSEGVESAPDLAAAESEVRRANDDLQRRLEDHADLRSRAAQLSELVTQLDAAVAAAGPARRSAEDLSVVADLCHGGSINRTRMSLERYVLASYLEEVAEAASRRLEVMTSSRYRLRHSADRVRGNAASGLSLLISDAYTGVEREVSTLSGGETFLASLSLALGLADVVQRHAGGVHVEALFIDEGFGSLDPETLDLAMAELDRLREGGRLVGVISHVPALRERIPVGIEVVAGPNGSRIRFDGLAPAS